jgi:hypothetical protein
MSLEPLICPFCGSVGMSSLPNKTLHSQLIITPAAPTVAHGRASPDPEGSPVRSTPRWPTGKKYRHYVDRSLQFPPSCWVRSTSRSYSAT